MDRASVGANIPVRLNDRLVRLHTIRPGGRKSVSQL